MKLLRPILLLLVLGACSAGERDLPDGNAVPAPVTESRNTPPAFDEFPAEPLEGVSPAPVDLTSHPEARNFRTALQQGMAGGPNFAGRHTVVTWGCGTMCQRVMVVDATTGRILTDVMASLGVEHRLDSRLLVVNPPEAVRENPCPTCATRYYLLMEEERLLEIPPEAWAGVAGIPDGYRPIVMSARAEEIPPPGRADSADVARTSWDRLVITTRDGGRHDFEDPVVEESLHWVHLFRGHFDPIDAFVVEKRYIPEGREFMLVGAATGQTTGIDGPPTVSPDGRRFVTASFDLVAGHDPNRIRIYRMEEGLPVVEWEIEPREWGARIPVWQDASTIQLERGVIDWNTHGTFRSPMLLRRAADGWTVEPSVDHARDALLSFLSALGTGSYVEAALLFGGTYDRFRAWNPDHDPQDRNGLWRLACEFNGLQCLGRAEILRSEQLSPTEVRFTVRLLDRDENPFVLGPCCGETEQSMPPVREFTFRVQRVEDQYLVMDHPPYVP